LRIIPRAVIDHRSTAATLTRVVWSSNLAAGLSPSFSKAAGVSSATWWQKTLSTLIEIGHPEIRMV
jgi:hypothetical protein